MTNGFPRRRNRLRYPGYDYAQPGTVFVTICAAGRQPLFGSVVDGVMAYSAAGAMVRSCWLRIQDTYPGMGLDTFVVMPDHVHGVLHPGSDPASEASQTTVGDVVRWFKTATIRAYGDGVTQDGWPPYDGRLWQAKFHDRIIRSDAELATVRTYIEANPMRWWERQQAGEDSPCPAPGHPTCRNPSPGMCRPGVSPG
jgi:REP element-mobilizing transposase RayT